MDRLLTIAAAVLLLSTCASGLTPAEVAAVIDRPTKESRAELAQAVSSALNGAPVTLADDALTRDSLLIVEKARQRDANGLPVSGRDLDKPEHFHLVKIASQCTLVHQRTGKRTTLASTTCRPAG
ncbi:MAG TPA: hypothetical protein VIV54_14165 [Burkholderiales bacterium]